MSELHSNIPPFHCLVRKEFLHNQESHHGEYEEVTVFGVTSSMHLAITFTIMTKAGAQFTKIPIHALCNSPCNALGLSVLQPWSCFSYNHSVIQYEYLRGSKCTVYLNNNTQVSGEYIWTIDWYKDKQLDTGFSELPESQKTGHFIKLNNGNFTLQPNNRILWHNSDFVNKSVNLKDLGYKTNTKVWNCED
jgi:hypothetical protein